MVSDGPAATPGLLDTISWQGSLWLVPGWLPAQTAGYRKPVRAIRPLLLRYEVAAQSQRGEDYVLSDAIPRTILDGEVTLLDGDDFEIVEAPEFESPIPTAH